MEDIVMVPVPRQYLGAVYRIIGEAEAKQEPATGTNGASETTGNGDWSPNELIRMYKESPPVMRKVLSYLADRPGQVLTGPELAKAVYGDDDDRRTRKLPGALGAFGRRVKNRYSKQSWPFRAEWNYEKNVMEYEMDSWSAEQIRKAKS